MKREIKFRHWTGEEMVAVHKITFNDDELVVSGDGVVHFANSSTIMEYTGLHDKNGREIYEGDVLDIGLRNQDGKPVIAPVSYETYAAGYVLDNGGNGIWQRLTEDCEVIGNIFEDKQLLEGKHD